MQLLVQTQFASLAEGSIASGEIAFERFLVCVNEHVLLEVLAEREAFEADNTSMLFYLHMRGHVSSE